MARFDMLTERLALSDTQTTQIFDITQKYRKQHFELRKSSDKAKRDALIEAERAEIKSVLTAEQQAKFDEIMSNAPQDGRQRKPGYRPGKPDDKKDNKGNPGRENQKSK